MQITNENRLDLIKHYYTNQRLPIKEIAFILMKEKDGSTYQGMRRVVHWYIKTYGLKRKKVIHIRNVAHNR